MELNGTIKTISFSKAYTNHIPAFFRWKVLFSQLPNRPFFLGVGIIATWLLLISFLLHSVHAYLDHTWGRLVPRSTLSRSWTDVLLNVVIIGPVLETWLFLKGIFTVAKWIKLLPRYAQAVIVLSSALFALSHFYSIGYIIYTFPMGCLLGSAYWYGGCTRRTFWIVVVAHATFNGLCFLKEVFEVPQLFGI